MIKLHKKDTDIFHSALHILWFSVLLAFFGVILLFVFVDEERELSASVEQIGVNIRAFGLCCGISCGDDDELALFDVPFLFQFLIRGAENSSHARAHDRFSESC